MRHAVSFSSEQIKDLLSGKLKFDIRFYKKRPEFFKSLSVGDIIFFRKKRGEIIGQFEAGKLILVERLEAGDWSWIKEAGGGKWGIDEKEFEELVNMNSIMLIIQIKNLEQLITSPLELPKGSRKEWIIVSEE